MISKIRKCIDLESTKMLVHDLVISRLDYGNSVWLLYGVTKLGPQQTPALAERGNETASDRDHSITAAPRYFLCRLKHYVHPNTPVIPLKQVLSFRHMGEPNDLVGVRYQALYRWCRRYWLRS